MNPQKLAKWKKWLGDESSIGTIHGELSNLADVRKVFSGVKDMVGDNPDLQRHSLFYSVFSLTYQHTVLMYVRRQVRRDSGTVSLIKLADDLHANCESITDDFYSSIFADNDDETFGREQRDWRDRDEFHKLFGGAVQKHLDPVTIESDITELQSIYVASSSYIDRRIAHLNQTGPDRIPTHDDLEKWCDTLIAKLEKYYLLLYCVTLSIPTVMQHDWKAIFRIPWIPESGTK